MKKRYRINDPENEIYNNFYTRYQDESELLNMGRRELPTANTIIWDKRNIQAEILHRVGDAKGYWKREVTTFQATIPALEVKLVELEILFREYSKNRIRSGFAKPEGYPPELLEKKLKIEARWDVTLGEVEILQKKLTEIEDQKEVIDESRLLQYGLRCMGVMKNSILVELDGQKIVEIEPDLLIIDNGKYAGLSVSDYHILTKQWQKDRWVADAKLLKQMQENARSEGQPVPSNTGRSFFAKVAMNLLPTFPDWAINHKMKVESSLITRKRTK